MSDIKFASDARSEKEKNTRKSPKANKVLSIGDLVMIKSIENTAEVVPIGKRHRTGERFHCYGVVTNTDTRNLVYVSTYDYSGYNERYHINDLEKIDKLTLSPENAMMITRENIKNISEEYYQKYYQKVYGRFKKEPIPVIDNNFLADDTRTFFNNYFLSSGCDCGNERFIEYKSWEGGKALRTLSQEVDNGDYIVYLPVNLTQLAGYTEQDVKNWIDLLNNLEFEVPLEFKGVTKFKLHRGLVLSKDNIMSYYMQGYTDEEINSRSEMYPDNKYYKVILHGCECGLINEYVFRLLSSLYDNYNKIIPGLTFQLKSAVNDISDWEAILAATLPTNITLGASRYLFEPFKGKKANPIPVNAEVNGDEEFIEAPPLPVPKMHPDQALTIADVFASENSINYVCRRVTSSLKSFPNSLNTLTIKYSQYESLYNLLKDKKFEQFIFELKMINNEKN